VAEELDIRRVVLPGAAGLLAALGLVIAGERRDEVLSVLTRIDDRADVSDGRALLERRLAQALPGGRIEGHADCRYVGQTHALTVPWDPDLPLSALGEDFHAAHRRRFGDAAPDRPVEIVSLRMAAATQGTAPDLGGQIGPYPNAGPAAFPLDGATAWLSPGWTARPASAGAVLLERDQ
jgi:N-methylhydantoinase A